MDSEFDLKPREELERIVQDISKSLDLTDMHIELASDKRSRALLDYLAQHFFGDEPITKSLAIKIDEGIKTIMLERFSQNLSLLLISDVTDEIIGCRTIALERHDPERDSALDVDENVKIAMRFVAQKDSEMDIIKYFNVDHYAHFMNLGVRKDFRRKGLATKLLKAALQFLSQIGLEALCIKGEASANQSQRIYEKFDFTLLHTLKYEDYLENGKVVILNTGENKSCNIYVKQL